MYKIIPSQSTPIGMAQCFQAQAFASINAMESLLPYWTRSSLLVKLRKALWGQLRIWLYIFLCLFKLITYPSRKQLYWPNYLPSHIPTQLAVSLQTFKTDSLQKCLCATLQSSQYSYIGMHIMRKQKQTHPSNNYFCRTRIQLLTCRKRKINGKQEYQIKNHTCKALSKSGLSSKISLNNLLALFNCPIIS